jgi:predicted nucleotidyltransferase
METILEDGVGRYCGMRVVEGFSPRPKICHDVGVAEITREILIRTLRNVLEPLPYVDGAWLGGSAAFGKLDSYSDVDLCVIVEDDSVDSTFNVIEKALEELSPIAARYETSTTSAFRQRAYSLRDAPEFLIVEAAIFGRSNPNRFLEREIHGVPVVLFDKSGAVRAMPLDIEADLVAARQRLPALKAGFQIFQHLTKKEIARGHAAEALLFYHGFTLRPLVEALRILHCPHRRMFHLRYLDRDFPPDVAKRIGDLTFVKDVEDLAKKRVEAEEWFWETIGAAARK